MIPPEPRCPICGCYLMADRHGRRFPHLDCLAVARYRALLERLQRLSPAPLTSRLLGSLRGPVRARVRRRLEAEARLPVVTRGPG